MSNYQNKCPESASAPIALTSNFHAGQIDAKSNFHTGQCDVRVEENFHAGNFHAGNFHAGNFHAGQLDSNSTENFHAGNFHTGKLSSNSTENFHAGNFHAGRSNSNPTENFHAGNFHAGNFHAGQLNSNCAENFHAGNFHAGESNSDSKENFHAGNFHAGNFHAGKSSSSSTENFHAGNFHAGKSNSNSTDNFHAGNFHAGNFHAGESNSDSKENFHAGKSGSTSMENFHAGNFHAGNFHAGNFHAGESSSESKENFHAGQSSSNSTDNFHAGNFHAGNFHAGDRAIDTNTQAEAKLHVGNFHAGDKADKENFHAGDVSRSPEMDVGQNSRKNFHAGIPKTLSRADFDISNIINFHSGQFSDLAADGRNIQSQPTPPIKSLETSLSFYASTFDGKPGFNYVEKPADGIYSNVTTSSHQLSVTDIRGSEDQLSLDRDAVLTICNIPDHGHTFTDDAVVIRDFYPEVEQLLLEHVPSAHRVFIFDHTIRRKFGDRGPVLRAHIDQTPASALARITRHLPDEAATLSTGRVRLINFWRPINGTVENYPLAFALSGSVPDTALVPVKHHYPTWTGETYGVGYSEGQNWCYWSKMGNSDALLLQCFDSEKRGRLVHSAVVDPTSTSQKYRESIEVRALVFG